MPVFGTSFSDPTFEAQAQAVCGGDPFCLFDAATTSRLDIGLTTLISSQIVENITTLAEASELGAGM